MGYVELYHGAARRILERPLKNLLIDVKRDARRHAPRGTGRLISSIDYTIFEGSGEDRGIFGAPLEAIVGSDLDVAIFQNNGTHDHDDGEQHDPPLRFFEKAAYQAREIRP